jgi:hypothetical protein
MTLKPFCPTQAKSDVLLPAIALNKGLAWDKTGDAERSLTKYFKIQTKFGVAFALSFPLIDSPTTVYKVLNHTPW